MAITANFKYVTEAGLKEGVLALEDYRKAEKMGMTVSGLLNAKYSDYDPKYGTAFEQACASLGIYLKDDLSRGITASRLDEVLDGTVTEKLAGEGLAIGGTIVTPSQQGTTPASRIFFPEVVLSLMNENLLENNDPEMAIWNRMISSRETIQSAMFTQPLINVSAPRGERSQRTSQNSLPRTMISITASEYSKSIGAATIGLEIAHQAQQSATIDLVATILAQQAQGERYAKLWEDISNVVNGNVDAGQSALPTTLASTYDAAATGGTLTQKAWLKALYDPTRKVSYDSILCTLDTFLAIQNRQGRPLVYDPSTSGPNVGALGTYGLNVEPNLLNWSVGVPNVMLVPDGVIPANHILMFDSRYALREVVNASASYAATEEMVLQRTSVFRVDFGAMVYRLSEEAFKYLDFS
jgi:hypothetical protein